MEIKHLTPKLLLKNNYIQIEVGNVLTLEGLQGIRINTGSDYCDDLVFLLENRKDFLGVYSYYVRNSRSRATSSYRFYGRFEDLMYHISQLFYANNYRLTYTQEKFLIEKIK